MLDFDKSVGKPIFHPNHIEYLESGKFLHQKHLGKIDKMYLKTA